MVSDKFRKFAYLDADNSEFQADSLDFSHKTLSRCFVRELRNLGFPVINLVFMIAKIWVGKIIVGV